MAALLTLLGLLGGLLAFAFVLAPLRDGENQEPAFEVEQARSPRGRAYATLLDQREAALEGLAELDFDRDLGNLSDDDYRNLRAQYRAQALGVLKALDANSPRGASAAAQPAPTAPASARQPEIKGLDRRVLWLIGGVTALGLLGVGVTSVLLRGNAAPRGEDAPTLGIVHAHAALLVPGTRIALVGHQGGLLRSSDDGRTWAPVDGVAGDVLALAAAPAGGPSIFLATEERLLRSEDAGVTWQPVTPPQPGGAIQAMAVGEGSPSPLYVAVSGAGLYRSEDMEKWKLVGGVLPVEASGLVLRPGPLAALYTASAGDGVLASGDEGQNWGSANGVLNGTLPTLAVRALAVDPQSGDRFVSPDGTVLTGAIYAGTDLGLFKSIDGGSSWSGLPLRQSLSAVSARSVPEPLMLAIDSRGRAWRSSDRGANWSAGQ